jgi:hypothetical protein
VKRQRIIGIEFFAIRAGRSERAETEPPITSARFMTNICSENVRRELTESRSGNEGRG